MKRDELAVIRGLLEDQLHELRYRAESSMGDLFNTWSDSQADPLDRATTEQGRNYTLRIRDRESRLITKIKNCLRAINDGEYGICESCGEPIAFARLKARPVTSYCIGCKSKREKWEKAAGY